MKRHIDELAFLVTGFLLATGAALTLLVRATTAVLYGRQYDFAQEALLVILGALIVLIAWVGRLWRRVHALEARE